MYCLPPAARMCMAAVTMRGTLSVCIEPGFTFAIQLSFPVVAYTSQLTQALNVRKKKVVDKKKKLLRNRIHLLSA